MFETNYAGARKAGIPTAVDNYSYATSVQIAVSDAQKVLAAIKGKEINTVWMDVEDDVQKNLGMKLIEMIKAYQKVIEDAGYKFGVYTGLSFYNTFIKQYAAELNCPFWVARYNKGYTVMQLSEVPSVSKKPAIIHALWGWQYTSSGRVDGISGNIDLNLRYEEAVPTLKEELPMLRNGSRGYYVGYLQEKLNALGYDSGKADKIFGPKTLAAVKAFQRANGLGVDGIVGPKTWAKLN